jgi:hypothetical protein
MTEPTPQRLFSITPPFELVQLWMHQLLFCGIPHPDEGAMISQPHWLELVEKAAHYGADQELDACCEWLQEMRLAGNGDIELLCATRRPKLETLNSIALKMLDIIEQDNHYLPEIIDTLRKALKEASK